ncbi:MAG TPA: carbohydrate ABC transporter permease [Roseiflexaceae bacterium]|nr:carbohydrate ABC transporter permease [Roseiflexaceae bacterium]
MRTTANQPAGTRVSPRLTLARVRRLGRVALAYGVLLLLCTFVLLPLGWMLTAALKPDRLPVFTVPPQWFPTEHWRWENFARALTTERRPFLLYMLNTLQIVAGNIVGTLFSCSLVAFAFARLRFRGSELLFNLLVITMLIPWQVLMIPQFLMFHKIGWYGTFLPLIVPSFTGNAFFIFLIRQYMRTFPRELDDAARIDGCGYFGIFWHVILPLTMPVLAVCVVFVFLGSWNDLLGPLIYLDSNRMFTVAIGLANMVTRANTDWNLLMAANLVTMLPALIVYFFAQDKLIGGIASVGLKG